MKNFVINVLKFTAASIYAAILGYLLWLIFYFITPWIMCFSWQALFVYIIAGALIIGIFNLLCSFLMMPMILMKLNNISKILPIIILLFWGYCIIILPWGFEGKYNFFRIILAICININLVGIYIPLLTTIISNSDE